MDLALISPDFRLRTIDTRGIGVTAYIYVKNLLFLFIHFFYCFIAGKADWWYVYVFGFRSPDLVPTVSSVVARWRISSR